MNRITKNMGKMDRIIRFVVVLLIGGLFLADVLYGPLMYVLLSVMILFLFTSITGFCPLYKPIDFDTKGNH